MRVNEVFIVETCCDKRRLSFCITYEKTFNSGVEHSIAVHSLESYNGFVDFVFKDLQDAISYFKAHASDLSVYYKRMLERI